MILEKFIPPFMDLINENFDSSNHKFIILGKKRIKYGLTEKHNVIWIDSIFKIPLLMYNLNKSSKIIIHGLFSRLFNIILFFQPWLLKKSYWVLWGGDLYTFKLDKKNILWHFNEIFRSYIIKNIGFITTTVPGDFELAKNWYNTKAKYIENLMYQSHVFRDSNLIKCLNYKKNCIYIQIGNSADPSNNHFDIIDKLIKYKEYNIKFFCPLSYGDENHKKNVINYGINKLGKNFYPIVEFMQFEEYNNYMSSIDIAIFNHDRQQGMGNIIGLLSLGKKIYMKDKITPYLYFENLNINIYSIDSDIKVSKLAKKEVLENESNIKLFFTKERLVSGWAKVFEDSNDNINI
jgi:hypothetical protein